MIILLFKIIILQSRMIIPTSSYFFFFASDRRRQAPVASESSVIIILQNRMIILVPHEFVQNMFFYCFIIKVGGFVKVPGYEPIHLDLEKLFLLSVSKEIIDFRGKHRTNSI